MKRRRSLFLHLSHIRLLAQKFALVILFLVAFVSMLINKTDTIIIDKTSSVATNVVSPIIDVLVVPAKMFAKGYDYFRSLQKIHQDNMRLSAENKHLNELYDRYLALKIENKILRDLLNYVTPPKIKFISARVIAEEGDAFTHSMIVYVGNKKVRKGQAVLADRGLIGRIDEVRDKYARILLATDINSKIPVIVEKTRVRGILSGDNTSLPKMVFIPLNANINIGDRIVTSGVAGVFPAGLPVGKVVSVKKRQIAIKLFSSLEKTEYVKLVDYELEGLLEDSKTATKESKHE